MHLLLDTHFALWWQSGDRRVSPEVRALVMQQAESVHVSQVSLWELTIKSAMGKVTFDPEVFAAQVTAMGFRWLPIRNSHILRLHTLPALPDHRDPFDRLLVSQSLSEPLLLVTADRKLAAYGATVRVY